jgi:hypothetical protein
MAEMYSLPDKWLPGLIRPADADLEVCVMDTGPNQSAVAANWWGNEFWRFVYVQQEAGKLAQTAIDFPTMQKGASFNLEAIKAQIEAAMKSHAGD